MKLAHSALTCRPEQFDACVTFYRDIVGAKQCTTGGDNPRVAHFSIGDDANLRDHDINLIASPTSPPKEERGPHTAFNATVEELREIHARARAAGCKLAYVAHEGANSLYVTDPAGNRIEFRLETLRAEETREWRRQHGGMFKPITEEDLFATVPV